jgi:hypothetical protein
VRHHNASIQTSRWKLVNPSGFQRETPAGPPAWELYDIVQDPGEAKNVATAHPDTVRLLQQRYDAWFDDVSSTRPDNYAPPRIGIGSARENPTVLTRQDWRHRKGTPWAPDSNGLWLLEAAAATYDVRLRFRPAPSAGEATLRFGPISRQASFRPGETELLFTGLQIPGGPHSLEATMGSDERGPWQVDVIRR